MSRRTGIFVVILLLLSGAGFVGERAAVPHRIDVPVSALQAAEGGILEGDFTRPWPFRINKRALDGFAVHLPDGRSLQRFDSTSEMAQEDAGPGFFVDRPRVFVRLDMATLAAEDAALAVTLPVRLRGVAFWVPFGLAALLLLVARVRPALARLPGRRQLLFAGGAGSVLVGVAGLAFANGPGVWLALGAVFFGFPLAVTVFSRAPGMLINVAVIAGAVFACCVAAEALLGLVGNAPSDRPVGAEVSKEWFGLPPHVVHQAEARADVLIMPDSWRRQDVTIEGAWQAYLWHGALHVIDRQGFRRLAGVFPEKAPETLRIMVVGDSMTYGVGIKADWTFSRILETGLGQRQPVEVINLGRPGFESHDILEVVRTFLPYLKPDIVVYAAFFNDFLPSGRNTVAKAGMSLPRSWSRYFLDRTRLARLADDAVGALLLRLNLRQELYEQILAGISAYRDRFAADVAAMNAFVKGKGLPPIVGIVFQHMPGGDEPGWTLVNIAEQAMTDAGFDVVTVKPWRERYPDRTFLISRWDAHANEIGHSLVAKALYDRLLEHPLLRQAGSAS